MAQVTNKELAKKAEEQDERITGIESSVSEILSLLKAKDNPVTTTKAAHDTLDQEVAQAPEIDFENDPQPIKVESASNFKDKADRLKFDQDELVIRIHDSPNPDAEAMIPVSVNGRTIYIQRGVPTRVKRCYVGVLLNSKITAYQNEKFTKPSGEESYRYPARTGLRFPFEILKDPTPRETREWMESILRAA